MALCESPGENGGMGKCWEAQRLGCSFALLAFEVVLFSQPWGIHSEHSPKNAPGVNEKYSGGSVAFWDPEQVT